MALAKDWARELATALALDVAEAVATQEGPPLVSTRTVERAWATASAVAWKR